LDTLIGMFSLSRFVSDCISASDPADVSGSVARLRRVYKVVEEDAAGIRASIPNEGPDEVLLHEDDRCTIYIVRTPPGVLYAPHDHGMVAIVGVFEGAEANDFFTRARSESLTLPRDSTEVIREGCVTVLDADVVHAISCEGSVRSQALHVYLGNLGAQDRSLFHPTTGAALPFTMENYFGTARPPQPIPTG